MPCGLLPHQKFLPLLLAIGRASSTHPNHIIPSTASNVKRTRYNGTPELDNGNGVPSGNMTKRKTYTAAFKANVVLELLTLPPQTSPGLMLVFEESGLRESFIQ